MQESIGWGRRELHELYELNELHELYDLHELHELQTVQNRTSMYWLIFGAIGMTPIVK